MDQSKNDGSWKFDYRIFDTYVELAMSVGIDKAITIYTPVPWGDSFVTWMKHPVIMYMFHWLPTSEEFKTNWNVFLNGSEKAS